MPTSLTGLLLFVVLLLPGFAYLVGKERRGTERRTSGFRETVSVVAVSVISELFVLVVSYPFWSQDIDVGRLVRDTDRYWECHYATLVTWALGILLAATVLAYALTWMRGRRPPPRARRFASKHRVLTWPARFLWGQITGIHPSTMSAWWWMLEGIHADKFKRVVLELDDGSCVSGTQVSFNTDANDTEDRDIVLMAPIKHRPAGKEMYTDSEESMVCVSARRIVTMFVTPVESTVEPTSSPADPAGGAESAAPE
jgi:hypothetical protein